MGAIIHRNGIIIEVVDKATGPLRSIASQLLGFDKTTNKATKQISAGFKRVFAGINKDLTQGADRFEKHFRNLFNDRYYEMISKMETYRTNIRTQIRQMTSMIMAGVAMSMSGITLKRAGESITRMIRGWTAAASEFQKTMSEISFLGQVTSTTELNALERHLTKLGVELPTSNLETAQAALVALKTGYDVEQSKVLARHVSLLSFFSNGALDAAESMKLLDSMIKQTHEDSGRLLDILIRTMTVGPLDIGEIARAWRSSSGAYANLGPNVDLPTFMALMTAARTGLNPRRAGFLLSQFSGSLLNLFNAKGERGEIFKQLGLTKQFLEESDPLTILDTISKRSQKLWGDTLTRMSKLQTLFNRASMSLIIQYENFEKQQGKTLLQVRDAIKDAEGYAEKYLERLMNTYWGVQEVMEGTRETFRMTMGKLIAPAVIPAMKSFQGLLSVITKIIDNYPALGKTLGIGVGLTSLLFSVGGAAMIASGQLVSLYGSLHNIALQLAFTSAKSFRDFMHLVKSGSFSVKSVLVANFLKPLGRISLSLLKILGLIGLVGLAWATDFMGIRSGVTNTFRQIGNAADRAREQIEAFKAGKVGGSELKDRTTNLLNGGLWDNLTGKIIKFKTIFEGLSYSLRRYKETGKYVISKELMSLLTGTDVGSLGTTVSARRNYLLEDFTQILNIITRIKTFFDGFIEGTKFIGRILNMTIITPLKKITELIMKLADSLGVPGTFLDTSKIWNVIGRVVGSIAATAATIRVGRLAMGIPNALYNWTFGKPRGGGVGLGALKMGGFLGKMGNFLAGPWGMLAIMLLGTLSQGEGTMLENIKNNLGKVLNYVKTKGPEIVQSIISGLITYGPAIAKTLVEIIIEAFKALGKAIWNMIMPPVGEDPKVIEELYRKKADPKNRSTFGLALSAIMGEPFGGQYSPEPKNTWEKIFGVSTVELWNRVTSRFGKHARGGFINSHILTHAGDDGPEVIIPLGHKYRNRAVELYQETGKQLGLSGNESSNAGMGSFTVTFEENSIQINMPSVDPSTVRVAAEELFRQFIKKIEVESMRNYLRTKPLKG